MSCEPLNEQAITSEDIIKCFGNVRFETDRVLIKNSAEKVIRENPGRKMYLYAGSPAPGLPVCRVSVFDCGTDEIIAFIDNDDAY